MKPSNIPGFTAEQSLTVHRERYRAVHSTASGSHVVPAISDIDYECFFPTLDRALWRCGSIGGFYQDCFETAVDLAASVCRTGL
jgi:hypothetical protein